MGSEPFGIEASTIKRISQDIKAVQDMGKQICIVIGGGNIFRGVQGAAIGIERVTSDQMGMLATVMNALALQSSLEELGMEIRVMSAVPMSSICEPFIRRRAMHHLERGRVVIFAAGTGSPYFTTDTAATLRASEMNCDVLMKGTKVDGVYSEDPVKNPDAEHFNRITYSRVLVEHLQAMDASAIALARENKLPVVVFSIQRPGNLAQILNGNGTYTEILDSL